MAVVVDLVGLASGLESESVPWRELADDERAGFAVDEVCPTAICWPESYQQAARTLAIADRLALAVSPRGGGTKLTLGNPPRRCDLIVSTERLNQIVEYAPSNLTVIAQAGVRLATLQTELAAAHQHLPLDPPLATLATLGGIVATNDSGPRRLGYGTARDLVIGTAVATTFGTVTRSGGRVVKNVAGYDLNKLYIRILGSLALVVEIGFKIAPLPAAQTTVIGRFSQLEQLTEASRVLLRSPLMPVALDLFNPRAGADLSLPNPDHGYLLAVLGAAPGGAVRRQATGFARVFREAGAAAIDEVASDECDALWRSISERRGRVAGPGVIQLKLAVPPGQLRELVPRVERTGETIGKDLAISGRAGTGVVEVDFAIDEAGADDSPVVGAIEVLRRDCQALSGSLVIAACPTRIKARVNAWGDVGSSFGIMHKLKSALDPNGTMNPGRFVGGI